MGASRHDDAVGLLLIELHCRLRHLDQFVTREVGKIVERLDALFAPTRFEFHILLL
jgi:hypothetical protein